MAYAFGLPSRLASGRRLPRDRVGPTSDRRTHAAGADRVVLAFYSRRVDYPHLGLSLVELRQPSSVDSANLAS